MSDNLDINDDQELKDNELIINAEQIDRTKENAIIKLKTIYHSNDGNDETGLFTKGIYRNKGNLFQIIYQDSDDTDFFDCETKITINGNNMVTILKRGDKVGSDLIVQCGKKLYSKYDIPLGSMSVGIMGISIDNHLTKNGGSLFMKYTIDLNGSFVSENEVNITVELL